MHCSCKKVIEKSNYGDLKVIKNTLPNTLGNPKNVKEYSHGCRGFAEGVLHVVLFSILCFKLLVKKRRIAKILHEIWELFLCENNHCYNSHKFAFILFFLFCPFVETIRIKFSTNWWSGNEKHFYFFFIANHTLFERYGEVNILL